MNPVLSLLLGTATLCAQAPLPQLPAPTRQPKNLIAPTVQPATAPQADTFAAAATATPQRLGVLFDSLPDALWVRGDTWKASFDANGATFIPFLGSDAPRNFPVRFRLADLHVGSSALTVGTATVARDGATAVLQRAAVREEYVASDAGIEQRFVFASLPQRDALTVGIDVTGEFAVTADADGHRFTNEHGSFRYGRAVAIDAKGEREDLVTTWNGARFTITVPAPFVARAQLPLVIDPLIGNAIPITGSANVKTATDVAYDASLHTFVVCWSQVFSATDHDVYAQELNDALAPIGAVASVDVTTAKWSRCRIANLAAYDRFLVVASKQVAAGIDAIVSRTYTPGGSLGAPVQLSTGATNQTAPDVGGDPSGTTPTYFTVVWEEDAGIGDRDVRCVQVLNTGAPRTAPLTVANAITDDHTPRISRSNGRGAASVQDWLIVYRSDYGPSPMTNGAFLTWNGVFRTIGNAITFPIAVGGPALGRQLAVTAPTDPAQGSNYLVVDAVIDPLHSFHQCLRGTLVDRTGAIVALNSQLTDGTLADAYPCADTDGGRFAVSFVEQAPTPQLFVGTYDLVGQQLVQHELVPVSTAVTANQDGGLVSMHGAGGGTALDREYALAWLDGAATGNVMARRYTGMAGSGVGIRATGCGPLTFAYSGVGAIGTPITFQQSGGTGIGGFAFGSPINAPLPQCPGCTVGSSADILLLGNSVGFDIPFDTSLVGLTISMQGFDYGFGTCLGALWLGDTADLAIH